MNASPGQVSFGGAVASILPRRFSDRFTVKSNGSFIFLHCAEVEWIEAQGDYVKFHAGSKSCLVRMTMKALGRSIDPSRFLRIHRSTVVNLDRIEKIMRNAVDSNEMVFEDFEDIARQADSVRQQLLSAHNRLSLLAQGTG